MAIDTYIIATYKTSILGRIADESIYSAKTIPKISFQFFLLMLFKIHE